MRSFVHRFLATIIARRLVAIFCNKVRSLGWFYYEFSLVLIGASDLCEYNTFSVLIRCENVKLCTTHLL